MREKRWSVWDGTRIVYASNSPAEAHNFAERFATVYNRPVRVRNSRYEYEYEVGPVEGGHYDAGRAENRSS